MKNIHRKLAIIIKLFITIILLYYLFKNADINIIKANLSLLSISTIISALIYLSIQIFLTAYRLEIILKILNIKITYPILLKINYIGQFFNQTLPSTVGGDAVRLIYIKNNNVSWLNSVCSIFYDRYVGLLSLFLIISLFLPSIYEVLDNNLIFKTIFFLTICGLASVLIIIFSNKALYFFNYPFFRKIKTVLSHGKTILFSKYETLKIFLTSITIHLLGILAIYSLSCDFEMNLGYFDFLIIMPFVFLFSSLPISIAGWGTRESAIVYLLGLMNINSSDSLILSVTFGIMIMIAGLPGSLLLNLTKKHNRK